MIVQSAAHALSSDNVAIGVSILVDSSVHAHSAENLTLSVEYLLQIANAAHAVTSPQMALTQEHTIIISNALHDHLADNIRLISGIIPTPEPYVLIVEGENTRLIVAREERTIH
jgi:hypothetical protein